MLTVLVDRHCSFTSALQRQFCHVWIMYESEQIYRARRSCCDYPVVDYGRLWPCLHAFCMGCVSDFESCKL